MRKPESQARPFRVLGGSRDRGSYSASGIMPRRSRPAWPFPPRSLRQSAPKPRPRTVAGHALDGGGQVACLLDQGFQGLEQIRRRFLLKMIFLAFLAGQHEVIRLSAIDAVAAFKPLVVITLDDFGLLLLRAFCPYVADGGITLVTEGGKLIGLHGRFL